MTLQERKALAVQNMHRLYEEYAHYDLMNAVKNAKIAKISPISTPTFSEVVDNIGFTEVRNRFLQSSPKKFISSVKFYPFTQENYSSVLTNPKIDLSKMTLLKRYTSNTEFEYRLAYEMSVQ